MADQAPAFAFTFQARRFACDRCHRYKLKCERGPLIMSSGIATPLGPCKRCEKAGVDCTSGNAATSTSSKKKDVGSTDKPSEPAKTSHARYSPHNTGSATEFLTDAGSPSTFSRPYNGTEPILTDPGLYWGDIDFDIGAVGGEGLVNFNTPAAADRGLPSPDKSQSSESNKEFRVAEQPRLHGSEETGESSAIMSDLLNSPPAESLLSRYGNTIVPAVGPPEPPVPKHPMMETLNKLSELQALIFCEFGCISEESLSQSFLSQSTVSALGPGSTPPDSSVVGKVLDASSRLIDILTSCGRDEGATPSTTQLTSGNKRTHSDLLEDDESFQTETPSALLGFSSPTVKTITTHFDFLRKANASTINSRSTPVAKRTGGNEPTNPTFAGLLSPAKLTLLVCYVSLLGVYRSIFTQAFLILRTPPSSTLKFGGAVHDSIATHQPSPSRMSTATIMGFRIQLEMLTHT